MRFLSERLPALQTLELLLNAALVFQMFTQAGPMLVFASTVIRAEDQFNGLSGRRLAVQNRVMVLPRSSLLNTEFGYHWKQKIKTELVSRDTEIIRNIIPFLRGGKKIKNITYSFFCPKIRAWNNSSTREGNKKKIRSTRITIRYYLRILVYLQDTIYKRGVLKIILNTL